MLAKAKLHDVLTSWLLLPLLVLLLHVSISDVLCQSPHVLNVCLICKLTQLRLRALQYALDLML